MGKVLSLYQSNQRGLHILHCISFLLGESMFGLDFDGRHHCKRLLRILRILLWFLHSLKCLWLHRSCISVFNPLDRASHSNSQYSLYFLLLLVFEILCWVIRQFKYCFRSVTTLLIATLLIATLLIGTLQLPSTSVKCILMIKVDN